MSVRQEARKAALASQAARLKERREAEKRQAALGIDVAVALAERDEQVSRCEERAAAALVALTGPEGLSLAQACEWAGDLEAGEARRLLKLVEPASGAPAGDA